MKEVKIYFSGHVLVFDFPSEESVNKFVESVHSSRFDGSYQITDTGGKTTTINLQNIDYVQVK